MMTNADAIRNMTNDELDTFIRTVYLCGKNGDGFSFCDYNLELWLEKDYKHCSTCKFKDAPYDESSPCYKCATEDSMWQAKDEPQTNLALPSDSEAHKYNTRLTVEEEWLKS